MGLESLVQRLNTEARRTEQRARGFYGLIAHLLSTTVDDVTPLLVRD